MPCYHPLSGWYSKDKNESGKRSIVFNLQSGYKDKPLQVPCGRCIGCRLEKARQWAVRCTHEASLYDRNCFLTLTYNEDSCPESLVPKHFVDFMKRLRHRYGPGIRFFHCGEYGEKFGRPHHHTLLFNHDFDDKRELRGNGPTKLWESSSLAELWPYGFSSVGRVTFESAGYIARYSLKKVVGPGAADWYMGRVPEYLTMSRRPGIGKGWIERFRKDVYPSDEMVINGVATRPPRYYDDYLDGVAPNTLARLKRRRARKAAADPNGTGKRLLVREVVREARVKFLSRDIEG
ncbi:MAG: replication initiator protein [Microviridae sp.]|nr:MAG: replication initiator protein [Microviridae sp.]